MIYAESCGGYGSYFLRIFKLGRNYKQEGNDNHRNGCVSKAVSQNLGVAPNSNLKLSLSIKRLNNLYIFALLDTIICDMKYIKQKRGKSLFWWLIFLGGYLTWVS